MSDKTSRWQWWRLTRAVEFALPAVEYFRVRRLLEDKRAKQLDSRPAWKEHFSRIPKATAMADEVYAAESDRIGGLEEKVRSTLGYITPFVPLAAAGLVVSADPFCVAPFVLSLLGALQLLGSYLIALTGTEARRRHMVTTEDIKASLQDAVEADWAARKLSAAERNIWVGLDLNNAVSCITGSLIRAIVALSFAGAILLFAR